jgi:type II secretory pathway component PulF
LIVLSGAARNPTVWLVAAFLLLVVWGRLRRYTKTKVGSIRIFRVLSVVPVLGNILTASSTSRYACAMAALLENGVNLTKALPLAALASESPLLKLDSADLAWNMTNGASLTEHMRNEPDIYDDILVQLVAVGEETSELAGMYGYAARYYDMETTNALDAFSAAIEPVLLCLVAGIVGFIMLGLFLPMYSYLSQI